ncbi:hypothetical protein EV641_11130 [Rhodococcus sp. SMB37]|uniref:hypothetical protein n=1 Tax=Rhodococcus sp. SMB37 TaxID=2512213 RepID=UPI0006D03447|nr:hypothetical protein [Rhodococcus sp. SMB37]TCN50754.1 hypothetical protein EV641_11130 [Rhodococcus sp. SMB37]
MQSLACHACGTCVLVAKYSPAHTSIQWTGSSEGTCHELAAARELDTAAYLLRCGALDHTVDVAVAEGRIPQTTRVEPHVRPLPSQESLLSEESLPSEEHATAAR